MILYNMNENSRIGFIYEINGYGLNYIGSTIQPICERKASHKTQYKDWVNRERTGWKCASYDILDKGNDWDIKVIETILTDTLKTGLLEKEQYWIETKQSINGKEYIVNKNQAIQSTEDLKEYKRLWAEQDRRNKGIQPKVIGFDNKEYQREWAKAKRASLTPEQKEVNNAKRREARALKKV